MKNYLMFRFWIINFFITLFFNLLYLVSVNITGSKLIESLVATNIVLVTTLILLQIVINVSYEIIRINEMLKMFFVWIILYAFIEFLASSFNRILNINFLIYLIFAALQYSLVLFSIFSIRSIKNLSTEFILLIYEKKEQFKIDTKTNKLKNIKILEANINEKDKIFQLISTNNLSKIIIENNFGKNDSLVQKVINFKDTCSDVFSISSSSKNYLKQSINFLGMKIIPETQNTLSRKPFSNLAKRTADFFLSGTILLILSPLFCLVALLIKIESNGPIFFIQKRNGLNGKVFNIFKFRSMYFENNAELIQATKNDSRVTKIGLFLRKSSIDELPQLLNIFLGDMSLIGPRPHAVEHNKEYGLKINNYMRRHSVRPGLTGYAQIKGLRGETKDINAMRNRVKYDLAYIQQWSLWLDIKILIMTPIALIKNEAY